MGSLGFQTLNKYGLVNADEWQTILTNDAYGMPRYITVMYWVEVRTPLSPPSPPPPAGGPAQAAPICKPIWKPHMGSHSLPYAPSPLVQLCCYPCSAPSSPGACLTPG